MQLVYKVTILLLLFIQLMSFAQSSKKICITGTIRPCYEKGFNVSFMATLKINDSIEISAPVDSLGRYVLYTDTKTLTKNKCQLYSSQRYIPVTYYHKDCPPAEGMSYVSSKHIALKPPFFDTIINDFCLNSMRWCWGDFPTFFFKKNTVGFVKPDSLKPFETLANLRCKVLSGGFVIIIAAHADSKENHPSELSAQRATFIKEELLKLGVPDSMMVLKAYGATKQISKKEWTEMYFRNIIEDGRSQNRRVDIGVLRKYP